MVPGLILAAGRSSRIGQPKALLTVPSTGVTFVRGLALALCEGGAEEALVVGRPDDRALQAEVAGLPPRSRFVPNPDADTGQLSSVLAGLRVADRPGVHAVLVIPVDVPLVTASTVATLLSSYRASGAPIVRAVHGGRHGHPVIFARSVFEELRHVDPNVGAKAVLRAHEKAILNVEVEDPGVVIDVDTPEDYARLFGRTL